MQHLSQPDGAGAVVVQEAEVARASQAFGQDGCSTSQRKSAPGSVRVAIFSVFLPLPRRYWKVMVPLLPDMPL